MERGCCSGQVCGGWCPHMSHWIADRRSIATIFVRSAGALAGVALLSGCATPGDSSVTLFADPGKYQYSSCEQMALQRKTWTTREQELKQLLAGEEKGAGA